MHRILKDTGSIYLQMDIKINHWIRCIMDDIFGYFNIRNEIIWKKSETGKGAKNSLFSKDHDTILYYTKSNVFTENKISQPNTSLFLKEFKYFDEISKKYFKIVNLGKYSKLSISKMKENNEIYTSSSGKQYKKYYLDDMQNNKLSDI
jgi:adenine specific DNA methylase Mod